MSAPVPSTGPENPSGPGVTPKASVDPSGSTTISGAPAPSDRNSLSIGPNGPLLLHDVHLVDTLAHFNRENIPERKPHAKGGGAFGEFETTADVSAYTKAALFQRGAKTRMLARFSTVAGELGSPDTWRDVRGFSLRFYTTEGNFDLVGNNTPVFFVRDPMKFPHFIRSQKRMPDSGLRDMNMQWDFWTLNPESAHQVTYLMGDRGLPKTWRNMNGYSSHTYLWVNAAGERHWVKYHFHTAQGVENLEGTQAEQIAGQDADFHRRDLFQAIKRGDFPKWTLYVQLMPYDDALNYHLNPFDLTKVWPHADYPLVEVGTMTLNENPVNHFAQIEQAAFAPSNTVPGIGFSPDKMLLSRVFAYADAHRARLGTNAHQLPVNQPIVPVNVYDFDGHMNYTQAADGAKATYAPNSAGRSYADFEGRVDDGWEVDGEMVRQAYTLRPDDDDFTQPGNLVRDVMDQAARDRLVETVATTLQADVSDEVQQRAFWYWTSIDPTVGAAIEAAVAAGKKGALPGGDDKDAKAEASKAHKEPTPPAPKA